jgi:hypothetical protein
MHFMTFIIVFIFLLVGTILFGRGLMRLYQRKEQARGLISSGFMVGLLGVVIAAIVFGVFNS